MGEPSKIQKAVHQAAEKTGRLLEGVMSAAEGFGPLLQRDYWTVISHSRLRPSQVLDLVANRFWELAPERLCLFERADHQRKPLRVGDEMEIRIPMAGKCRVRVLHRDTNSITLGTLQGHPEAGRITFGAYRNVHGDVVFHIRSRARSSSGSFYAGFVAVGEAMQTNTWTEFVNRVALTAGDGVLASIHAETARIEDEPKDESALTGPTFVARGD